MNIFINNIAIPSSKFSILKNSIHNNYEILIYYVSKKEEILNFKNQEVTVSFNNNILLKQFEIFSIYDDTDEQKYIIFGEEK